VGAVVIYHAFPALLPAGFIGVDIFFVISGFLITGVLLREGAGGALPLRTFYARRVLRIFPALLLVLLTVLAAGWVIMTSEEYGALGYYTAGGAVFVDNILFWRVAGYFDTAADTKPLLHLWSLGIEEQFYLVWPPVLWLCVRYLPRRVWPLWLLLLASLAFSMKTVGADSVQDFYSPFTRFWELMVGCALAWEMHYRPVALRRFRPHAAHVGVALLLLGLLLIRNDRQFPGYWALLPTVGAALVIASGSDAWINRQVFSGKAMVSLGLISYPLYLWHWPLLSFTRILLSQTPAPEVRVALVAISTLLAWLTYLLLERPLRFGEWARRHRRWVVALLSVGMVQMLLAGHTVRQNDGFKERHYALFNADPETMVNGGDRARLSNECGIAAPQRALFEWCASERKPVVQYAVLGDSKGESLFFGLSRESDASHGWRLLGAVNHMGGQQNSTNAAAYASVEQDPATRVVVLVNALRGAFPVDEKTERIERDFSDAEVQVRVDKYTSLVRRLQAAGKQVVFVVDNPTLPDPNSCVHGGLTSSNFMNQWMYRRENGLCTVTYTQHLQATEPYRRMVQRMRQENPELVVYDPTPLLCDMATGVCGISEGRNFLYSYGDHISDYAGSKIARELLPVIFALKP
jgi:peptidoglycan/LPS O-acetylase OafA/YrhL